MMNFSQEENYNQIRKNKFKLNKENPKTVLNPPEILIEESETDEAIHNTEKETKKAQNLTKIVTNKNKKGEDIGQLNHLLNNMDPAFKGICRIKFICFN